MLIQIRVIINVPLEDENRYPQAIENIVAAVKKEFPGLTIEHAHSPVTVIITDIGKKDKPDADGF